MKLRLTFLATIAIAISLALVGVLKDVNPTQGKIAYPVQPFHAVSTGGINTTQLGQQIASNYTQTQVNWGERVTLPWIYSGAGFSVYQGDPLETDVGSVFSAVDVGCNGDVNYMQLKQTCANPPEDNPLRWIKKTTAVSATDEAYLLKIMPPFPWLLRHRADILTVCVGIGSVDAPSVLNTVYANIPFSPTVSGNQAFVAQTQLGGAPDTPPSKVCLDSPQNSTSITTVYVNPPVAAGAGLYARWTIFASKGSSSLNLIGDLRKSYQSPPSLPSDIGYVERTIQIECFWEDQDVCADNDSLPTGNPTSCDDDNSGFISPEESWDDAHLVALGGKVNDGCPAVGPAETGAQCSNAIDDDIPLDGKVNDGCPAVGPPETGVQCNNATDDDLDGKEGVDADGDCLMNAAHASSGWGTAGFPGVDAVDDPTGAATCGTADGWVNYSENPVAVSHNKAEDQDCDGLVDGIEWFWGGNDLVTSTNWDNDGAPDFVEMFQFTNPKNGDTDGTIADPDGDGFADKPASVYGTNTDVSMDNCPTVYNPDQLNTDGGRRPNGPNIPNGGVGDNASNPSQDKIGDACDTDNDNDLAVDGYEQAKCLPGPAFACDPNPTNLNTVGCECDLTVGFRPTPTTCQLNSCDPFVFDTDADTVGDGFEIHSGGLIFGEPLDGSLKPAWDGTKDQVYYRGCQINVNNAGPLSPNFDPYVLNAANQEIDPDGDGTTCPTDNDSDTDLPAKKAEVPDKYEVMGYGTLMANQDTDGDGCADWVEIFDLNGDRKANSTDVGLMNSRAANKIAPNIVSDRIFDVNKDNKVNSLDTGMMNTNNCLYKSGTGGCGVVCNGVPNG